MAQDFPWPVSIGSHLRLAQVMAVAAELGETDVFAFVPARRTAPCVLPPELAGIRLKTVVRPRPSLSLGARWRWLTSARLPLELAQEDAAGPRRAFESWAAARYDFVWFSKAQTFELLGRPRLGPTIVDLDDLEDQKDPEPSGRRRPDDAGARGGPRPGASRRGPRPGQDERRSLVTAATAGGRCRGQVALCSELDATRSGLANVAVVPNGYDAPAAPSAATGGPIPRRLLLAGNFVYPPNADAARLPGGGHPAPDTRAGGPT